MINFPKLLPYLLFYVKKSLFSLWGWPKVKKGRYLLCVLLGGARRIYIHTYIYMGGAKMEEMKSGVANGVILHFNPSPVL